MVTGDLNYALLRPIANTRDKCLTNDMTIQGRNYHWGRRSNCLVWFSENGKWNKGKKTL